MCNTASRANVIPRSIFICFVMPALPACAQPFSFGIVGGEGLTQDFQNYDLPPNGGSPPGTTVSILGVSTPQRWIAGGTVEARLPLHLSVEVDALYHILRFREGNQSGQAPPQLFQYQHSVTWEFPVLLKYRFQLPRVKPFIDAGPTFRRLVAEPNNIAANLTKYLKGFSRQTREILEKFSIDTELVKLEEHNRLFLIVKKFAAVDLHPETVDNRTMGYIFEELIRKFNEAANEEAGDHFTPREVIRLMVDLLFAPDHKFLTQPKVVRTMYDPACGTGGMLSVADEYLDKLNPDASLELFGQDWNEQAFAVCGSDMLVARRRVTITTGVTSL